ncbi:MAG TPA: FmdB family zinc ribbon protein [Conexibacter sp.]|nr:FmdB family zinc ribbon protein [Conexibacter sp.]
MPIYEYRCEQGHTFEVIQRMSDDALDTCEVCESPAVRVLHAPAVHFKGSGFYNTDYGTKKRARERGAGSEGRAKSSGESASSDSSSTSSASSSSSSDGGSSAKKADAA